MDLEEFELVLLRRPASAPDYPDEELELGTGDHAGILPLRIGNWRVTVTALLPPIGGRTMRYYEATSTITASPEAVWAVLSDGASWPNWDSGVDAVEGRIAMNETVTIRSQAAPGRAFPVRVTRFDPPGYLRFSGGMPLGLFRGVRTYEVSAGSDGQVAFRMREEYSGPLLPLIWRSMPDLGPSFQRFAQGLKQRVEAGG